jgi:hypothetical protein
MALSMSIRLRVPVENPHQPEQAGLCPYESWSGGFAVDDEERRRAVLKVLVAGVPPRRDDP